MLPDDERGIPIMKIDFLEWCRVIPAFKAVLSWHIPIKKEG